MQISQEIRLTPRNVRAEINPYRELFVIDLYLAEKSGVSDYYPISVKIECDSVVAGKIIEELNKQLAREEEIVKSRKGADQRMLDSFQQLQGKSD